MLIPILTNPNPELRKKSEAVDPESITTQEMQDLFDNMLETMRVAEGVGLAAPQLGIHKRIFVGLLHGEPHIFINPELSGKSLRKADLEQGCLSIPGVYGVVKMHKSVTVSYLDRDGNKQKERFHGFEGYVAQHENDHLDGILFIDRAHKFTSIPETM